MINSRIKLIATILMVSTLITAVGCSKEKSTKQAPIQEPFYWITEFDNPDENLYQGIAMVEHDATFSILSRKREREYKEYNKSILTALVYQMERYKDNPDKTFHVLFFTYPYTVLTEEWVEDINEKCDLNMNMNDWVVMHGEWPEQAAIKYYYTLTAQEIKALAEQGATCMYVGSGEGDRADINMDTDEGQYVFLELYGDQVIQYKEGMDSKK